MIEISHAHGVTVLTLAHGKANALDLELCGALQRAILEQSDAEAVVLTGRGSIFSAGVDLVRYVEEGAGYAREFLEALRQMFEALVSCERPVVAAINGHAIAGGCLLAAACDLRLLAEGKAQLGVPELLVGLPFPRAAVALMESVVPPGRRREVLLTGRTWSGVAAIDRGLADRLVPPDALLDTAIADSQAMGAIDRVQFTQTKRHLLRDVIDGASASEWDSVVERWTSPAAGDAIRSYLERTLRK